jgi:hypothetical protein
MASDNSINSIISQGIAVKEIYNPKKQNLEVQQHFNTQHTEIKKTRDKTKIKQALNENRVENKADDHKKDHRRRKKRKRKKGDPALESQELTPEGNFIDIKV